MSNDLQIKTLRTQLERQKGQQLQIQSSIVQTNRDVN